MVQGRQAHSAFVLSPLTPCALRFTVEEFPRRLLVKIGVRSILLALSFLVKKAEKGRVFTICLFMKEFFV